ncbi:MAG: hypothetical protein Q8P19_03160 [bacterium]|nr:hypothetical protein [bacterium]
MEDRQDKIIEHLDSLNKQIMKQNSFARMFTVGIIYGIGFFVGSAIIATIALGIFGPWFAKIPWVHDTFISGASILSQ